ncbi:MAG: hypothetical protein Kow0089_19440 [Desulfobulbaceae bacterium]
MLALLQSSASAAVAPPQYELLAPLAANISAPTDVAVDNQGRVYVAETSSNRVVIFTQNGAPTGGKISVTKPISVAVDNGGRVLVGSKANGSVSVFSSALGFLFKLGAGNGEFGDPRDIAVDTAGNIYVVDLPNNTIRVYDGSGNFTGTIGTPGNGPGQLWHPVALAIDENAGEIVVLDKQQILDTYTSKMIDGARIQYFNLDGTPVPNKSYSKFGYNNAGMTFDPVKGMVTVYDITMGELTRPNGIAVDALSRVYVTDARMNLVMVYDNFDNFLTTVQSTDGPVRIPMGLAASPSGRLYVTSPFTGKVQVFGVDDYTALAVAPTTLSFSAIENGTVPAAQTATISNEGKAVIDWQATTASSWVSLGATSGTLLVSDPPAGLDVSVDSTGFAAGVYRGTVTVDTGKGASEEIQVVLEVASNPLQVAPASLTFDAEVGTTPEGQNLAVSSSSDPVTWDAVADQSWITLNKNTGTTDTTDTTVRVYVDPSSLAEGTHTGTVTFSDSNGSLPDVTVDVTLNITPEGDTSGENPGTVANGGKKWKKRWSVHQVLDNGTNLNGVNGISKRDLIAVGDNGTILHFDGREWTAAASGVTDALNKVWSLSDTNAVAVGASGVALQYDGTAWTMAADAGDAALLDIWGSDTPATFAVDELGTVYDATFIAAGSPGTALRTIFGTADDDLFAAGEAGAVFHDDGTGWAPMVPATTEWLNSLWANASDDVFAVGENGAIVHYDGSGWSAMQSPTARNLNGVCGFGADDVFAVGNDSLVLHYDGSKWEALDVGAGVNLNDVWCAGRGLVVAVGDNGTVVYGRSAKFPWVRVLHQIAINGDRTRRAMMRAQQEDEEK